MEKQGSLRVILLEALVLPRLAYRLAPVLYIGDAMESTRRLLKEAWQK
jgi:hypothetical protein